MGRALRVHMPSATMHPTKDESSPHNELMSGFCLQNPLSGRGPGSNPDLRCQVANPDWTPIPWLPIADTLIPNMTVYEMLMYTAELKNSRSMPLADKRQKVGTTSSNLLPRPCVRFQEAAFHRLQEVMMSWLYSRVTPACITRMIVTGCILRLYVVMHGVGCQHRWTLLYVRWLWRRAETCASATR